MPLRVRWISPAGALPDTRCHGRISDDGIRNASGAAAIVMPVFAAKPSAPTNITKHHAVEIGLPMASGGVAFYPGDIMMGEADGVMVLPRHLADGVAAEAVEMELFAAFVLNEVTGGASIRGLYPPTYPETLTRYEAKKSNHKGTA